MMFMAESVYRAAGVDLEKSTNVKQRISDLAEKTYGPAVLGGVGGFGAMYGLSGYQAPVLVSSTDPIGTKLMIARMMNNFEDIGEDLVNACVNDLIVCGADPLFFLDYIATSRIDVSVVETIVRGIATACADIGCALIGGETSEMPGLFIGDNFDLSGFVVGAVEHDSMLRPHETIRDGDVLIGLPSNGLHTNGYSLIRHIFGLSDNSSPLYQHITGLGCTLGQALLLPHRSYYKELRPVFELLKGIAHITGGGLIENVPRMLPVGLSARLNRSSWEVPGIFETIQEKGSVSDLEMYRVFNMGLGMVLACDPSQVKAVVTNVPNAIVVGGVISSDGTSRVFL